ncbi:glycosyl hydrolase family 39 [Acidipila sp. EB88]|uniref:GH39 family glycosyl hydrolase n=1 Tax=Acidipila sp. EB88 TaxID=2305226 RepID=UPI000F5F9B73|nr:glycosyl hydrolase family 39 [Acidipila sp. EB88]RRA48713.1 glycosyl hydrolase family 39 [Acidipila sp. EB88]
MIRTRQRFARLILPLVAFAVVSGGFAALAQEQITIDASAPTTPFLHFWEKTFGSGRAVLSLRESYRDDLGTVKAATNFESIRFHGILMDEVGVYDPDRVVQNPGLAAEKVQKSSPYNFFYVDEIYDGLLAKGVKPFIELSFMPKKMAADPNKTQSFFYRPIVSPPKNYADWDAMLSAFAAHLVGRYGIDEVASWKFEVWNEPNLDFWGGDPRQSTYFELYDHTARALKAVSPRLQVGGPSTAQAAWVSDFLAHTKSAEVPVDFVSTHVYGNDTADNVLHTNEDVPRDRMVYRAVKMVHEEILKSAYPKMPLIFSEYGPSYANEPNVSDTTFVGPWLANTIRLCDGLTDTMAYWDFSDVFEEQGVVHTPFYGGFGLIAAGSIPKPALNAFAALHKLGDARYGLSSESALATRSHDGSVVAALWNYAPPTGTGAAYTPPPTSAGTPKTFHVQFQHVPPTAAVTIFRVDDTHGNVLAAYDAMGRPEGNPTAAQLAKLRAAGAMAPPEQRHLAGGVLEIAVPPHGLAVVLVK